MTDEEGNVNSFRLGTFGKAPSAGGSSGWALRLTRRECSFAQAEFYTEGTVVRPRAALRWPGKHEAHVFVVEDTSPFGECQQQPVPIS